MHSKDYKNALDWRGKHGVVVGTANTGKSSIFLLRGPYIQIFLLLLAQDIAEDMVNAGLASVTLVQRSKTCTCLSPEFYYDL
jgi:cation diffusion facilitator CzcD-associated flavoprotein CzcO